MSSNLSPKNFTFLISIISSMKLFAVLILTIVCSLTNGTSDKKTSLSVASLVPLLEMERQLINNLEEYTIDLKQKLQILERYHYTLESFFILIISLAKLQP